MSSLHIEAHVFKMAADVNNLRSPPRMNDLASITRLQEEQQKAIFDCESRLQTWEKFKEDYNSLDETLQTLPEKISHDIMVPFGSLAFMPGKLIHTNEILVLLGDNWFVERSAKQAREIIQRRQTFVDQNIEGIQADLESFTTQLKLSHEFEDITKDKGDVVEIKEEVKDGNRNYEKGKRIAHAKAKEFAPKTVTGLKENRLSRKPPGMKKPLSADDKALFAKLDQLELVEKTNEELVVSYEEEIVDRETQSSSKCSTSRDNDEDVKKEGTERRSVQFEVLDSDDDDDDDDEEEEEEEERPKHIPVHFSRATANAANQVYAKETKMSFQSPADIYKMISREPRGILKTPSVDKPLNPDPASTTPGTVREIGEFDPLKAFSGTIVERARPTYTDSKIQVLPDQAPPDEKPAKRVSKFKAARKGKK